MRANLSVSLSTLGALTPQDFSDWHDLSLRAIEPYPYCEPEYWEPAVEYRPDVSSIELLIVRKDRLMMGLMFIGRSAPFSRFPRLRALTSAEPTLVEESTRTYPLVDSSRAVEVVAALINGARGVGRASAIDFNMVPDGPLVEVIRQAAARGRRAIAPLGHDELAFVQFNGSELASELSTPDFTVEGSSKRQAQTRQRARALSRDLGELVMLDRSSDPAALDDLLAIQMAGWKGDSSRGGESYRLTGLESWFKAYTARFREEGRLSVVGLQAGGSLVYVTALLRSGCRYFGLIDTFDESLKKYSPGALGRIAVVNWLQARGANSFDPNLDMEYVQAAALYADRRTQHRFIVGVTWSANLTIRAISLAAKVRARVKRSR